MNLQALIIGGFSLIAGAPMLAFPSAKRFEAEARIARRKAEIDDGGSELFFEERRSLDAYPPPKTNRGWRIKGMIATLLGLVLIGLAVFDPR